MKKIFQIAAFAAAAVLWTLSFTACDGSGGRTSNANGRPYEVIVSVPQDYWDGEVGDTLRAVMQTPVDMINQYEPMFDIMRINPEALKGLFIHHRNILDIRITPEVSEVKTSVQYNTYGQGQVIATIASPNGSGIVSYLNQNRNDILQIFEMAERDRDVAHNKRYGERHAENEIEKNLGFKMSVPPGYKIKKIWTDGAWIGFEYPLASQGIIISTRPHTNSEDFLAANLVEARNEFVKRIPGPSDGSYMTTSNAFDPEINYMLINHLPWAEMRGFWDVAGDFMGGPFVSYSIRDNDRIVTIEGYVFSPKHNKRNLIRALEHLVYSVEFPAATQ